MRYSAPSKLFFRISVCLTLEEDGNRMHRCLFEPVRVSVINMVHLCSSRDIAKMQKFTTFLFASDELLNLIGKEVGGDWISLGQQLDFKDDELQEIQDKRCVQV